MNDRQKERLTDEFVNQMIGEYCLETLVKEKIYTSDDEKKPRLAFITCMITMRRALGTMMNLNINRQ